MKEVQVLKSKLERNEHENVPHRRSFLCHNIMYLVAAMRSVTANCGATWLRLIVLEVLRLHILVISFN
jgi:hypothetical protein